MPEHDVIEMEICSDGIYREKTRKSKKDRQFSKEQKLEKKKSIKAKQRVIRQSQELGFPEVFFINPAVDNFLDGFDIGMQLVNQLKRTLRVR